MDVGGADQMQVMHEVYHAVHTNRDICLQPTNLVQKHCLFKRSQEFSGESKAQPRWATRVGLGREEWAVNPGVKVQGRQPFSITHTVSTVSDSGRINVAMTRLTAPIAVKSRKPHPLCARCSELGVWRQRTQERRRQRDVGSQRVCGEKR